MPNFYKHEKVLHLFDIVKETTIRLPVILSAVYCLGREKVIGLKCQNSIFFNDRTKFQVYYHKLSLFNFITYLLLSYRKIYSEYKKYLGKLIIINIQIMYVQYLIDNL